MSAALLSLLMLPLFGGGQAFASANSVPGQQAIPSRQAIIRSIRVWAELCPEASEDPALRLLSKQLGEVRAMGEAPLSGDQLAQFYGQFKNWKLRCVRSRYVQHSKDAISPVSFDAYYARIEQGLHSIGGLSYQARITPADRARIERRIKTLFSCLDSWTVHDLLQRTISGDVGALYRIQQEGSAGERRLYLGYRGRFHGRARVLSADGSAPPPAAVVPMAVAPQSPGLAGRLWSFIRREASSVTSQGVRIANAILRYGRRAYDAMMEGALVRAESAFHPGVTSKAGAMGLGQLMPGTAKGCAEHPYDIDENIACSARVLRGDMDHFQVTESDIARLRAVYLGLAARVRSGEMTRRQAFAEALSLTPMKVRNAIAGYNAGPYAIDDYGHGRYDRLPRPGYDETIAYVPTVLGYYFDAALSVQ
ncbi:MAG: lytic transglycosylase domain-containing protein [Elusimicrobia bacterium]|nr:lytic transglycosylase domain-containing protein [Elusimicrobiota bacterium]MDE2425306.1 lytic transglycosylase domain-containing protein [Elusimicrobiota bacterium]